MHMPCPVQMLCIPKSLPNMAVYCGGGGGKFAGPINKHCMYSQNSHNSRMFIKSIIDYRREENQSSKASQTFEPSKYAPLGAAAERQTSAVMPRPILVIVG